MKIRNLHVRPTTRRALPNANTARKASNKAKSLHGHLKYKKCNLAEAHMELLDSAACSTPQITSRRFVPISPLNKMCRPLKAATRRPGESPCALNSIPGCGSYSKEPLWCMLCCGLRAPRSPAHCSGLVLWSSRHHDSQLPAPALAFCRRCVPNPLRKLRMPPRSLVTGLTQSALAPSLMACVRSTGTLCTISRRVATPTS